MKIAITADPLIPVPPENYGGIERIIDFLVKGLIREGHEVALVAHAASKVDVPLYPYKNAESTTLAHLNNIYSVAKLSRFKPDVIHSFSRLAYLAAFMRAAVPKIMSYQREPTLSQIKKATRLAKKNSLSFTGCSNYITNQIKPFASAQTVYNGVDLDLYELNAEFNNDAPLVFLGRIEPIKGTHTAIEVAIKSKRSLIIAGNIPPEYKHYFTEKIEPFLNDQIKYVGQVNDQQKNELLRNALALLMPIGWDEPFGIVMAEAMACGTPVIGFNRGSVPEVVSNASGIRCNDAEEMVASIELLKAIDRSGVRKYCELNFGSEVIVKNYIKLYQSKLRP